MAKVVKSDFLVEVLDGVVKYDGLVIQNQDEVNEKIAEHYPHGLKQEVVDDLDKFRTNLFEAFSTVAAKQIATVVKEEEDLNAAEIQMNIGQVSYNASWARPASEKPTEKEWAASIGFGMGMPQPKALRKAVPNNFAQYMLEDVGAEDDEADSEEKAA